MRITVHKVFLEWIFKAAATLVTVHDQNFTLRIPRELSSSDIYRRLNSQWVTDWESVQHGEAF